MSTAPETNSDPQPSKAPGYRVIAIWTASLVVSLAVMAYLCTSMAQQFRQADAHHFQSRLDAQALEPGYDSADRLMPPDAHPAEVRVGAYLLRILDLSIADDTWTADFYIWFDWTDDSLAPGETFELTNGQILTREKQDEWAAGGRRYAVYRVVAAITQFFDVARFPVDDHMLTLEIEDVKSPLDRLRYVPDTTESGIDPVVKIPGHYIRSTSSVVKAHTYATTFGDPRLPEGEASIYSHYRLGIWLTRSGWQMHVKMFLGTFTAVLVALVSFFIKPAQIDARFAVRVGAFFGAVANTVVSAPLIPDTSVLTIADMVNGVALIIILLSVVEATVALHMVHTRGQESLAPLLDRVSVVIIAIGFVLISVGIPLVAAL